MNNSVKCKKAKFWIEEGVLFCKFKNKKCKKKFKESFLDEYLEVISELSKGRYYPLVIDLRGLKERYAISVVRNLAKNKELKSAILSKAFVVNSCFIQFVIIVFNRVHDPVIPNKIFTNYEKAIEYSMETNHIFNASY